VKVVPAFAPVVKLQMFLIQHPMARSVVRPVNRVDFQMIRGFAMHATLLVPLAVVVLVIAQAAQRVLYWMVPPAK